MVIASCFGQSWSWPRYCWIGGLLVYKRAHYCNKHSQLEMWELKRQEKHSVTLASVGSKKTHRPHWRISKPLRKVSEPLAFSPSEPLLECLG
jgi:hypothetical protein